MTEADSGVTTVLNITVLSLMLAYVYLNLVEDVPTPQLQDKWSESHILSEDDT